MDNEAYFQNKANRCMKFPAVPCDNDALGFVSTDIINEKNKQSSEDE